MIKAPKYAPLVIIVGVFAISSASILIKWCSAAALVIAAYRVGLASLLYLGIARVMGRQVFRAQQRREWLWIVGSGACLAFHFATWITSLNYTSVASSVVLVQTSPIFVSLGGALLLGEKPGLRSIAGIIIAVTGGAIIALYDSRFEAASLMGNSLALLGALGASGYFLLGRHLRQTMNTLDYTVLVYGTAALFLLIFILLTGPEKLVRYDTRALGLLFAIALVPQAIGHTSFNWALKYYTAASVSIMTLGESVGSSLLAWLLLHESLPFYKITGGIILLCGVVTVLINEKSHTIPDTLPLTDNR